VLLQRRVRRQDELPVDNNQHISTMIWLWRAYLTPSDVLPVCEKRILSSRRAGGNALASDMATEDEG
jgi:hypothetical protein